MRLLLLFSFLGRDSLSSRGLRAVTLPPPLSPSFCTFRVAPHCSSPLLLTQRARGTVPRKPGHGPRGCTVNAWNWNYRAISTARWYILARVSRGSSGSAGVTRLSHRDFSLHIRYHSLSFEFICLTRMFDSFFYPIVGSICLLSSLFNSFSADFCILDNKVSSGMWHDFSTTNRVPRLVEGSVRGMTFVDISDRIIFHVFWHNLSNGEIFPSFLSFSMIKLGGKCRKEMFSRRISFSLVFIIREDNEIDRSQFSLD